MKAPHHPHQQPQDQNSSPQPVPDPAPETGNNMPADVADDELLRLQEEFLKLQEAVRHKEEAHLRAAADLQNVRRRANEERLRLPQLGAQNLLLALLPTFDHLELALKNKPAEETDWSRGIEAIYNSFLSALQAEGIERIAATEVPVDPTIHEVITAENGGEIVIEVFQAGYRLGDKVIRPAKVRAGKGAEG